MTRPVFLSIVLTLLALGTAVQLTHLEPALVMAEGISLPSGIDLPTGVNLPSGDIRTKVVNVLNFVLSFLALIAVITIIVAGFLLILGFGSDASIQRAKKIIIYTIVGLIVIFFARIIVEFIVQFPV